VLTSAISIKHSNWLHDYVLHLKRRLKEEGDWSKLDEKGFQNGMLTGKADDN
jgi:hypothetical protein